MALMVVAHPDPTFTGRVAVEDVGLVFVGGFTGPTDVPTEVQAQLTAEGFTLNATPGANYGGRYILDTDLEDDDSESMVILRAAFGRRVGIDLRDWTAFDGTGDNDNAAVLAAAHTQAADGDTIIIPPRSRVATTQTWAISKHIHLRGFGAMETWGSAATFGPSLNGPASPYLVGSVIDMVAAGQDAIRLTGAGQTAHLSDFGVLFSGTGVEFTNTGHGINGSPPALSGKQDNGVQGSHWRSIAVHGHDGNHYGFKVVNPINDTFEHLRSYGGGGLSLTSNSTIGNYGNSVITHPYVFTFCGGTAHCFEVTGTSTGWGKMNLLLFQRPQSVIVDYTTAYGNPVAPTSAQYLFFQQNVVNYTVLAPDFEAPTISSTHNISNGNVKQFIDTSGMFRGNSDFTAMTAAEDFTKKTTGRLDTIGSTGGVTANGFANNLGTGHPAITVTRADRNRGIVKFGSGTPTAVGRLMFLQYQFPGTNPRAVVITPGNAATAALGLYVPDANNLAAEVSVSCTTAPAASQAAGTYVFNYVAVE